MKKTFMIEIEDGIISINIIGFMAYEILGLLELTIEDLKIQHISRKEKMTKGADLKAPAPSKEEKA